MRKIVTIAMCITASFGLTEAHGGVFQTSKAVLLEADYSARGMLSWMDGDHLVSKVYSDGEVEYEDVQVKNGVPSSVMRRAVLSKEELGGLTRLLESAEVRNLLGKYPAFSTTIDHSEDLKLKFISGKQVKEIAVENFKADLPEIARKYPKALMRLTCWAELVRKKPQARFFFRETSLCCNCR